MNEGISEPPPGEAVLRRALANAHGLAIADLTPELGGVDAAAWAYRATTTDGSRWFVKVRRDVRPAAVLVPRYLHDHGLDVVVASAPPTSGAPWLEIGSWSVLVSPLVDAPSALRAGLDLDGWRRLGTAAAALHEIQLPATLAALVPREEFGPKATALARDLDRRIAAGELPAAELAADAMAEAVAQRWTRERGTILRLVERADALGRHLRVGDASDGTDRRFVLCHADLHVGNVLVDASGGLRIVDWDELVFAPPERDLMFVRGAAIAQVVTDAQADAFEAGYGPAEIDPMLIAYYRIDWAVQDLAGFASEVLLAPGGSAIDRQRAADLFHGQFRPGDEVDTALAADVAIAGIANLGINNSQPS